MPIWDMRTKADKPGGAKTPRSLAGTRRLRISNAGSDLLSHEREPAVPSALRGLTTEFGMGSGVSPSLWPPAIRWYLC